MIRAFVGIPLPAAYQERLEELRRVWEKRFASGMSWTRKGNWHLTLKFLGATAPEALGGIEASLEKIRFERFGLQAGGGGFFPPEGRGGVLRPRVLWVGLVRGALESAVLARAVERAVAPLGFAPERRAFASHLTLARVKRAEADPWLEFLKELQALSWPACVVDRFTLWQSDLGASGPRYRPLFEVAAQC